MTTIGPGDKLLQQLERTPTGKAATKNMTESLRNNLKAALVSVDVNKNDILQKTDLLEVALSAGKGRVLERDDLVAKGITDKATQDILLDHAEKNFGITVDRRDVLPPPEASTPHASTETNATLAASASPMSQTEFAKMGQSSPAFKATYKTYDAYVAAHKAGVERLNASPDLTGTTVVTLGAGQSAEIAAKLAEGYIVVGHGDTVTLEDVTVYEQVSSVSEKITNGYAGGKSDVTPEGAKKLHAQVEAFKTANSGIPVASITVELEQSTSTEAWNFKEATAAYTQYQAEASTCGYPLPKPRPLGDKDAAAVARGDYKAVSAEGNAILMEWEKSLVFSRGAKTRDWLVENEGFKRENIKLLPENMHPRSNAVVDVDNAAYRYTRCKFSATSTVPTTKTEEVHAPTIELAFPRGEPPVKARENTVFILDNSGSMRGSGALENSLGQMLASLEMQKINPVQFHLIVMGQDGELREADFEGSPEDVMLQVARRYASPDLTVADLRVAGSRSFKIPTGRGDDSKGEDVTGATDLARDWMRAHGGEEKCAAFWFTDVTKADGSIANREEQVRRTGWHNFLRD